MTRIVDIRDAKAHLPELIEQALDGDEIILAESGQPLVKLVPLGAERKPRVTGAWKGKGWIAEDFDAPLPPDILDAFEGKSDIDRS